jgi:hypothetical protein
VGGKGYKERVWEDKYGRNVMYSRKILRMGGREDKGE